MPLAQEEPRRCRCCSGANRNMGTHPRLWPQEYTGDSGQFPGRQPKFQCCDLLEQCGTQRVRRFGRQVLSGQFFRNDFDRPRPVKDREPCLNLPMSGLAIKAENPQRRKDEREAEDSDRAQPARWGSAGRGVGH